MTPPVAHETIRVLFIGNSYTYFNNLPQIVSEMSAAARQSKKMETEMVVSGGATLKRLWEEGKALAAIKSGRWDYVVLQEQSTLGAARLVDDVLQISNPKVFHEYARLFDAEIKKSGAKTVFFLTWARQNAPETQAPLTNAYQTIAKELKAMVAPVGLAWENALKKNPQLALHMQDKSHPAPAGSYLAACVFHALFYDTSPEGLPGRVQGDGVDLAGRVHAENGEAGKTDLVDLPAGEAAMLQQIAWQTVKQQRK